MRRFTTNQLTTFVKYSYYKSLCDKMQIRKDIIRSNRKIKTKLEKQSFPYTLRAEEYIKGNQKKTIAFLALLGVMQYYNIFSHSYRYLRSIESFKKKLQRWILGVDNLLPPTIQEQNYNVQLSPESIDILEQFFQYLEKQFTYGVNRKFLYTVYDQMQLFDKPEERLSFYRQSGYFKKRNQKLCAVHCQQFVQLFEDALIKVRKRQPNLSESEFLKTFVEKGFDNIVQIQKWEMNIDQKRSEYKKLTPHLQDHKVRQLKMMLQDDPYIEFVEIDKKLSENGFMGMSIKDKLMVNFQQLQLHRVLLDSYYVKRDKYIGSNKETKLNLKVKEFKEKVQTYSDRQSELSFQFNRLFKKQELFPILVPSEQ